MSIGLGNGAYSIKDQQSLFKYMLSSIFSSCFIKKGKSHHEDLAFPSYYSQHK